MTHDEVGRLAAWLANSFDRAPVAAPEQAFARARLTRQRPAWVVNLTGGTIAQRPAFAMLRFSAALAVVALVGLLAGALLVGGVLRPKPAPPLIIASASPDASAQPTPLAAQGRIVFARTIHLVVGEEDCTELNADPATRGCGRSWIVVANQDGTGERKLFPDGPRGQYVVAMSPDGSRLIVGGIHAGHDYRLYLTDVNGSEPRLLDTGCAAPCAGDDGFAFSPDGSRLAFVRGYAGDAAYPTQADSTVIAIMDLSTGAVVELESTRAANPDVGLPCGYACGEGTDEGPHWSPDGQRLLFTRYNIGIPNRPLPIDTPLDIATFVVDASGDNLRQLVPTELFARDAQWSPDGSLIVFTSAVQWLALEGPDWQGHEADDIYTVRPDGTGVSRLTTESAAGRRYYGPRLPRWTSDGRIVFTRTVPSTSLPYPLQEEEQAWVMDADGQNATRLDPADVATMTSIGCVVCPAPITDPWVPLTMAYWVPVS